MDILGLILETLKILGICIAAFVVSFWLTGNYDVGAGFLIMLLGSTMARDFIKGKKSKNEVVKK